MFSRRARERLPRVGAAAGASGASEKCHISLLISDTPLKKTRPRARVEGHGGGGAQKAAGDSGNY